MCQCRLVHGDQGHAREWLGTAHAAGLQVRQDGGLVAADDEHAGVQGLDLCIYGRGGRGLDLGCCGVAGRAVLGSGWRYVCGCGAGIGFSVRSGRRWGRSWGAGCIGCGIGGACLGGCLCLICIAVDLSVR